jgi:SAM-dependent methyltransferase
LTGLRVVGLTQSGRTEPAVGAEGKQPCCRFIRLGCDLAVIHWNEVSPRWHEYYERGRPSYPQDVIHIPSLPKSAAVLELGAGTGKLTRLLVAYFERVIAVEPDPEMRRWCAARCPQARLLGGTAEQIPLAAASVDGVFIAEAFHWFAHERALAEVARVLRPRGALILLWNRPAGLPEPPLTAVERFLEPLWPKDIATPLDLDPSRFPHARDWPHAFEQSVFEPLQESQFPNPQILDRDGIVAFFGSMGWIGALPDQDLVTLLNGVRSRLTAEAYRLPFETLVYWTRLLNPLTVDRT